MCGFLGEFYPNTKEISTSKTFENLLALGAHRGPDSSEIISHDTGRMGFNRLAILDTSSRGNQPKKSFSKRYTFVFNGEIYNYKELIETYNLQQLYSDSDTEVLVHLFDNLGVEETISKLNGMFAIAIQDHKANKLYLTRDFAGIKPLFYGYNKNGVVFASQFDQVYKHPMFETSKQLRPEICKEYFGLGYMQAPNTIYKDIFQVNPGELIKIDAQGVFTRSSLISFLKNPTTKIQSNNYTQVLENVVQRQLMSDVPIATFLSGGIDSPLITALAYKNNQSINAYTVGVNDAKIDESKKAKAYADHIGVSQKTTNFSEEMVLANLEQHFKTIPEPFGDYSSLPTFLITKMAAKEQTVMLSGDGGDELFFGYPRMLDVLRHKIWYNLPYKLSKLGIGVAVKLKLKSTKGPFYYPKIQDWILAKQLKLFDDDLKKMFPNISYSKELKELYFLPNQSSKKEVQQFLRWNEFYAHLQRVLIKVDRTSMANSLEVRVPFLDKESIDYAFTMPLPKLAKKKHLKHTLKKCLAQFVPNELIEKEKKGFTVPLKNWLKNELKEEVHTFVFQKPFYGASLMDTEKVKDYVSQFYTNKHSNEWGVWHIYAWQKWAHTHLEPTDAGFKA